MPISDPAIPATDSGTAQSQSTCPLVAEHDDPEKRHQAESEDFDRVGLPDREAGDEHQHCQRVGCRVQRNQSAPHSHREEQGQNQRSGVGRQLGLIGVQPLRRVEQHDRGRQCEGHGGQPAGAHVIEIGRQYNSDEPARQQRWRQPPGDVPRQLTRPVKLPDRHRTSHDDGNPVRGVGHHRFQSQGDHGRQGHGRPTGRHGVEEPCQHPGQAQQNDSREIDESHRLSLPRPRGDTG